MNKRKIMLALVMFAVLFVAVAAVMPIRSDDMIAQADLGDIIEQGEVPPDDFNLDDIWGDAPGYDAAWIYEATVGGEVEFLDIYGTVVEAVSYRDYGGTVIELVPESFFYLGYEVVTMRLKVSWFLPGIESGLVDWDMFNVEAHLYLSSHTNELQVLTSQRTYGTFTFADVALWTAFDNSVEGDQTAVFQVIVGFDCLTVDGEVFQQRFVEDIPATVKVVPSGKDTTPIDPDDFELQPPPGGITDPIVYPVEGMPPADGEPIYRGIDPIDDPSLSMSVFGGGSSSALQRTLLLAVGITAIVMIVKERGFNRTLKEVRRIIKR